MRDFAVYCCGVTGTMGWWFVLVGWLGVVLLLHLVCVRVYNEEEVGAARRCGTRRAV